MTSYWGEFRVNWRPLVAASVGISGGALLNSYMLGLFAPHLIEAFGWTRAQFALVAANVLVMLVVYPFAGRLVDTLGPRRMAMAGVVLFPLTFVAFSLQDGNFWTYYAISTVQVVVGAATTAFVYSRLVATVFAKARGLAFAIVNGAPAVTGAIMAPIMAHYISEHGFRAGYLVIAGFTFAVGVIGLLLMPRSGASVAPITKRATNKEYGEIFGTPAFWLLLVGLVLCSLPLQLQTTQLQLVLQDNGAVGETAAFITSTYAIGVMVGRFLFGAALDRFSTPIVSAIGMGLPGVGLALLASSWDQPVVLGVALALAGLSHGAEGDIVAYVVAKYFPTRLYGTTMGLVGGSIGVAIASGAIILSIVLKRSETYTPFIIFGAATTFIGAALFLMLRSHASADASVAQPQEA